MFPRLLQLFTGLSHVWYQGVTTFGYTKGGGEQHEIKNLGRI